MNLFRVSVDGTDFRIHEPTPFSPRWYSHKFHGPGLRYEVGVSVATGDIVWAHGPFPCGEFSDVRIFRLGMKQHLGNGELVIADGGYTDEKCRSCKGVNDPNRRLFAVVRARHETVNRRFKQFAVLGHRFRHALKLHSFCFYSICNLTQIMLLTGEPLFAL